MTQSKKAISGNAHRLLEDCWMCQGLRQPEHLVFFESRTTVGKLNPDQFFNGYSFVTLKWHDEELYDLVDKDRRHFLEDMSRVARVLSDTFKPDKMNYELLGNGMPHLHWHLIPRYKTDLFWGRPIWTGSRSQKRLPRVEYDRVVSKLKAALEA